jgi:hypothetical protein
VEVEGNWRNWRKATGQCLDGGGRRKEDRAEVRKRERQEPMELSGTTTLTICNTATATPRRKGKITAYVFPTL